jgi:hypothetical protein
MANEKRNGFRAITIAVAVGLLVSVGGALLNRVIAIDAIEVEITALRSEIQATKTDQDDLRGEFRKHLVTDDARDNRQDSQLAVHDERLAQLFRDLFGPG